MRKSGLTPFFMVLLAACAPSAPAATRVPPLPMNAGVSVSASPSMNPWTTATMTRVSRSPS